MDGVNQRKSGAYTQYVCRFVGQGLYGSAKSRRTMH